jgi:hypothetical protein
MNKPSFIFNIVLHEVFNWSLNIATVMFLWSLNHFYCILLTGLVVLRHAAKVIHNRHMNKLEDEVNKEIEKELLRFQNAVNKAELKQMMQQAVEENTPDPQMTIDDFITPPAKTDENKKVH